jgi:hypothetical protein
METLTALEAQVLEMMLEGQDDVRAVLRQQLRLLRVSSREFSGVGFFTAFVVQSDAPRITGLPALQVGNVEGSADNVNHGLGFVLFVKDGALSMLEGYTYDEPWPDEVCELKLSESKSSRVP